MSYQFPDHEFEEIQALVFRLTGDEMGFNHLYNPDADQDNEAGLYADKILDCLQTIKNNVNNPQSDASVIEIILAIKKIGILVSQSRQECEANPILDQIVTQSLDIMYGLDGSNEYKIKIRIKLLDLLLNDHRKSIVPLEGLKEVKESFIKCIHDLQHVNDAVKSSPPPQRKKSLLSGFFSRSNKIVDSSQLVLRVPPEELKRNIDFLTRQLDDLQGTPLLDATSKINDIAEVMRKYTDELSATSPPLLYNAINKLTAQLLNQCVRVNNVEEAKSAEVDKIFNTCIQYNYIYFLRLPVGLYYQLQLQNNEEPLYLEDTRISDEEAEIFGSVNLESLQPHEALMLFMPGTMYESLYADINSALGALHERLVNECKSSLKPGY